MSSGTLALLYSGVTNSAPTLTRIVIKAVLSNGTFKLGDGSAVAFFGQPPVNPNNYPLTQFFLDKPTLTLSGGINSVYAAVEVETSDTAIVGTITASQALPYDVTIQVVGNNNETTLAAGQTSVGFDINLGNTNQDTVAGVVAAKLDEIQQGK